MSNEDFNELAGRIQGLGDFIIGLTIELELQQAIDGERFTGHIQRFAKNRCFDGEHLEATSTLSELARFIDEARQRRQQTQATQHHYRQRRHYR